MRFKVEQSKAHTHTHTHGTPGETKHGVAVHPGVLKIHARRAVLKDDELQLVVPPISAGANLIMTNHPTQTRAEECVVLVDRAWPRSSGRGGRSNIFVCGERGRARLFGLCFKHCLALELHTSNQTTPKIRKKHSMLFAE